MGNQLRKRELGGDTEVKPELKSPGLINHLQSQKICSSSFVSNITESLSGDLTPSPLAAIFEILS